LQKEHTIFTLDNGIRLVHRQLRGAETVHCGYMINAGSRDENDRNNGVAHFIEHTVFKGTEKRRSHHILRRIENVGGELNAFTTREKTCYYASCLKRYAGRAVDLLTDITFNSQFPENELQKEKKVILEEIDMYDDSPEESIYDDFYTHLFGRHPLGYNILGTKETVSALSRKDIHDFIDQNYSQSNIVLSVVGGISPLQTEKMAYRYLDKLHLREKKEGTRRAPEVKPVFAEKVQKDFAQTHCIMGSRAYSRQNERRYDLLLLSNILGGSGMSSRLNMAVREKHGLVYTIGSHYSIYQDTGVFSIYFGTDSKNLNRCTDIIRRELKKICESPLTERQIQTARQQMLGQTAMMIENPSFLMQHQARSLLDYGYVQGFKEYEEKMKLITPESLLETAREILSPDKMSSLVYEEEDESDTK
jgi:predicted Zn-dependent peptidase